MSKTIRDDIQRRRNELELAMLNAVTSDDMAKMVEVMKKIAIGTDRKAIEAAKVLAQFQRNALLSQQLKAMHAMLKEKTDES